MFNSLCVDYLVGYFDCQLLRVLVVQAGLYVCFDCLSLLVCFLLVV